MADSGFGLKIGVEGEREFKKSLSEINQTFKVLGSEMKLVQSQFDKNDNSVEALTARNATLNKQIDTQKEKISTLKAALENAASSFGENDKRTQAWQIQLNNAEAALNKMERELSQNDQALDNVGDEFSKAEKKADKFGDEVKETGEQAETSGAKFKKVGEVLKNVGVAMAAATAAIGTAAVAAGKKLWDMASETAKSGDEIDKTSQKLGMSAEAYQEWDYVLSQSGVEITSMTTGLKTLTNQIDDAKNGSVKAQERFAKLGISLNDLNSMSREDIFSAVVSSMQGMADTTERAALANDLFGKFGQNLTPLFNETTESTEKLKQAAHDLGFVMSDEAVKASAEFNDSLDTLKRTFSGVKNNLVGELLPGFSTLLNGLSALLAGNDKAKEQIQKGTQEIVDSLKDIFPRVMDILMTLIGAVAEIAPVIIDSLVQGINMGELVSAASNIVITFLESLISALPQIAEGAVKLITQLTDAILENLPLLVSTTMQVITTVIDGIADALPALIPAVVSALLDAVQAIIDNIGAFVEAGVKVILAFVDGVVQAIPVLINKIPVIVKSVIEALKNAIVESTKELLPVLIEGIIDIVNAIVEALPDILNALIEALPTILESILTAVIELLPVILDAVVQLITGIVNALPELIQSIIEVLPTLIDKIITAIVNLIPTLIQAILDCLPTLINGLIQLILGIVGALPDIIKSLIEALPQIISSVVTGLIQCIPQLIQGAIQLILGLVQAIPEIITALIDALPEIIESVITGLLECLPQLIQGCIQLTIGLVKAIPQIIVGLIKAIPTIITSIVEAFGKGLSKFVEIGGQILSGIWEGISGAAGWLWDQISGFFGGIVDGIKGFFGIHSPSTLFRDQIGKNLALGIGAGFSNEMADVAKEMQNAIPTDFDTEVNTTAAMNNVGFSSDEGVMGGVLRSIVNNITFGDVTINNDMDIEDIAHQVSDVIVSDVYMKGGAYA